MIPDCGVVPGGDDLESDGAYSPGKHRRGLYTYNEALIGYEYVWACVALIHERELLNVLAINETIEETP